MPSPWLDDLQTSDLELIESPLAWVLCGESQVWKLRKPLSIGLMDCRTPEQRKKACETEMEQHRQLAPNVYREILPVRRRRGGGYGFGGEGEIVDWALHMERLPIHTRFDTRLREGRLSFAEIDSIARHLARFHEAANAEPDSFCFANPEQLADSLAAHFSRDRYYLERYLKQREAEELRSAQLDILRERREEFLARREGGFIRNVHGDPRLAHIYLRDSGEIAIIDRLEFRDRFLFADTCSDLAALSMDLSAHGRVDLAEYLLASYADRANDFDLFGLIDFYEAYRAYLLGKMHAALAQHSKVNLASRRYAEQKARRYFLFAVSTKRRPLLPPVLVAMSGLVASGKSTVAKAVAQDIASPIVLSDHTRDALLGEEMAVENDRVIVERAFAPTFPGEVYAEVFRRAEKVLGAGRPVVIDGCFGSRAMRARVREIAAKAGVPFLFVECRCDRSVAQMRLRERSQKAELPEQVWVEIYERFEQGWEPVVELPAKEHVVVDTGLALASNVERLRRRLPVWPEGLTQ